jgi:prepilin signal peptidase PulO-like enzyme (type II secretory pathway)
MERDASPGHPVVGLAARVLGGLAAAMWLLPLVGSLVTGDHTDEGTLAESVGVAVLAGANIVGVLVAFRHPRIGGRLLLVSGVLFSLFALVTAGRNEAFAAAVSGGPFIVSGALFSVASRDDAGS